MSDYKKYREEVGIKNADMIRALRSQYKRYGGATNAMVNNPETYGVCLLPDAELLLAKRFGYDKNLSNARGQNVRKAVIRKKPNRLSVWLTDEMYEQFRKTMQDKGYETVQDFMMDIFGGYFGW